MSALTVLCKKCGCTGHYPLAYEKAFQAGRAETIKVLAEKVRGLSRAWSDNWNPNDPSGAGEKGYNTGLEAAAKAIEEYEKK